MFFLMVFAVIFAVAILGTQLGQIAALKVALYAEGTKFFIRSKDLPTSFKGSNYLRMETTGPYTNGRRTIRVVFVRHGQSVWNSIFNSINGGWPARVVKAVVRETVDFFTDPFDSVMIDSPLSSKGVKEANELADFFRGAKGKVSFDPATSVVVVSNLRRAMETALVGAGPRLAVTRERMTVDSSLQEGSRNIDAQTLSTERGKLAPMRIGGITDPRDLKNVFNPYLNDGGKVIGSDVYFRMDIFLRHLFGGSGHDSLVPASGGSNAALKEVIVVGHSGYFRNFFRRFLPASSTHIAKKCKMQNCAVVAFDLVHNESNGELTVDESSITVLYKGFK
ncbi:hypothetical protein STCU_01136 [Strigomonas culicis]|uniref:Uncharacterized protein n=3 Tax=Strigomonas culicis TaxID=28005 RepID=S9V3L9_9TRYP|nr:hypothetical protein STCU_01136 [Strigomonas culicis]|eukprot:EPY35538.1 hypothetical protein STCU_01136 [Strigomonas culicis]